MPSAISPAILPDRVIADILVNAGLGLRLFTDVNGGPNLFVRHEAPYDEGDMGIPRVATFVAPTGGDPPIPYFGDAEDFRVFSVQVLHRGEIGDYLGARTLTERMLSTCQRSDDRPTGYIAVRVNQSDITFFGQNLTDRPQFAFNVDLWYTG